MSLASSSAVPTPCPILTSITMSTISASRTRTNTTSRMNMSTNTESKNGCHLVEAVSRISRVLQFGDSLLPVGSFSFSNGLEAAIQLGVVHDLLSLGDFVRVVVEQAAPSDGVAVLAAFRAART